MTDHEYKTIFLHFVKTGGSSIERCFNSGDGYRETTYKKEGHPNRIIKEEHHTSSKKYISLNGKEIWDEYFKFSFVRNPWDWFVSHFLWDIEVYNQNKKKGLPQKYRRRFIVEECDADFEKYVRKGSERPNWFKFPSMKEFCDGVDYIGRFENLQLNFDEICDKISKPRMNLPRLKASSGRLHYSHYYNEETSEMIYNVMKEDVEHFKYKFEKE